MALKFYWGLEANSNTLGANDYSSGDSIADTVNGAIFSGTAAKVGSYGIEVPAASTGNKNFSGTSIWPATSTTHNTSVGSYGFWMNFSAFPGNGIVAGLRMYGSTTNYGVYCEFITGSYLSLTLNNAGATRLYATTALSTGTWYFVVCRFDIANDKRKIEIYTDAGGGTLSLFSSAEDTATDLSSALSGTEVFTNLNVGVKGGTTGSVYTDNFIISDSYDAPIQNNAFITTYTAYNEAGVTTKYLKLSQAPGTGADEKIYMTWAPAE